MVIAMTFFNYVILVIFLHVVTACWEDGSDWPWLLMEDMHECAWFLNSRISNKSFIDCFLHQLVSSLQEG